MILNSKLTQELFRGFYIQRWNDRIRPMEMLEMDKHSHKMFIAYCIAKYEEMNGNQIDWQEIIQGGIYELLRRIVISDIKSTIFYEIKKKENVWDKLNNYVVEKISAIIDDKTILSEFEHYVHNGQTKQNLSQRILEAAHIFSSYLEFQIIKNFNPTSYQNIKIETELLNRLNDYGDLTGLNKLINRHTIANFIEICGQLRFQIRWAQLPRIPKTSVLGHSMLVASLSYFLVRDNNACSRRLYNAFFGGLFHDLPEAVTRDIISPVKYSSEELEELIKDLEKELAEKEIHPLLESQWLDEIKYFTQDEFKNKIRNNNLIVKDNLTVDILNSKYNSDIFDSYDGEIIRSADEISAFLEAYNSCAAGIKSPDLCNSSERIKAKYQNKQLGKINLSSIFEIF